MKPQRALRGSAWLLAMALVTWLFVQAQGVNQKESQATIQQIDKLEQQYGSLERDVLKLRYRFALNYDELNHHLHELSLGVADLHRSLARQNAAPAILEKLPALDAWAAKLHSRLEHFKSTNALLGNAFNYFPTQADRLMREHPREAALADTENLVRLVLSQDFRDGENMRNRRDAAEGRLLQASKASSGSATAALLELDERYQDIMQLRADLSALSSELTLPPSALQELENVYLRNIEKRSAKAQTYRTLLFIVALVLMLYALSVFANLRERSQELRRALDNLHNQQFALDQHAIVSSANVQGDILYVNEQFCEISGYTREELQGENHRILNSGLHPPEMFSELWQTITAGKVWHGQICNRSKGGSLHWFNATIVPFLDEGGKPYEYISIRSDITSQKAQEAELVVARDAAEAASRAKSQFLASMSHEIRTPMNGILGMTGLALDTELDDEQREYLNIVKQSAEHLLSILNEILDFSKIEAGRLEIECMPFLLRETLEFTLKPLAATARAKNLSLDWHFAEGLPDHCMGDPVRLRQVVTNLVGNAIKFTETGGIHVMIHGSEPEDSPASLHVSVADTGIGIPVDKQEQIFAPFSQADASTTRRYGGTGLGLAISRQLVSLMGGRLWLESAPGEGSTFHFTVAAALGAEEKEELAPDRSPLPSATGRSLKILLAEDNAVNRHLAEKLLEKMGHKVQTATDGLQALEAYHREAWDLVILDMMMPELDGPGTARTIRDLENRHGGHVPIIAMTANAFDEDRRECLAAGMDGFVAKPVKAGELETEIGRVMQTSDSTNGRQGQ